MVIYMVMKKPPTKKLNTVMPAAQFKARCLALMDQVDHEGSTVTVTKRGKPVAVLAPVRVVSRSGFGFAKGRLEMIGDLLAPIDVTWDADR
jgi:prevent-host-death family protein